MKPTLKTYGEIKDVFSTVSIGAVLEVASNYDYADKWVYTYRWDLFDMPVDDEIKFDSDHVEDVRDMAERYIESEGLGI